MSIHQPSCNKDYTCALGDCPSFVSVEIKPGTGLRKAEPAELPAAELVEPSRFEPIPAEGYRILCPGIGGTGVVTVSAILAAAATMDGLDVTSLDQTGLAQKGGAVVSHLVLSRQPLAVSARINAGNANLILGFDALGTLASDNLKCAHPERTAAVVNTHQIPTADSVRKRLPLGDPAHQLTRLERYTLADRNKYLDASALSERYFGTHMLANMILLGAAWQAGLVPVSWASLESAIRLNGVDVERNLNAFRLGAHPPQAPAAGAPEKATKKIDYVSELTAYQNATYAAEHAGFVASVRARGPELADTVALHLFRLMAVKDEYEVARLLTRPEFAARLAGQWEAIEGVSYHLHPPLLRKWGLKRKLTLGPWFRPLLRLLAAAKVLRGTPLDVFGWSRHRRRERSLAAWYKALVEQALGHPDAAVARQMVAIPEAIRGYESIKDASIDAAMRRAEDLQRRRAATAPAPAATS
jgi:indolepyruvate ferredoxin oxidoreductase